jgi:hypothetical protein
MKIVAASALFLFGLAACAGPGAVSPSGGLMYQVPESPSVVYLAEGSQDINVDVPGMGAMNMRGSSEATLAMSFAPGTDGVQVTVSFQKLTASQSDPIGGSLTASESDIVGDLVFTMDGMGRGTVVTVPEVKGSAEQLVSPGAYVHEFFPRLPGRAVNPGESWTDTIQYEIQTTVGEVSANSVLTYTLVGDTVVDGLTLLHVTYEGDVEVVGSGQTQGMEMIQALSGDAEGWFLWDPARGLMVVLEGRQDMEGTTEMPASGMAPFPMTVRGSGTARLQGG